MAITKIKDETFTDLQVKNKCVQTAWQELRTKSDLLKYYPWISDDYVLAVKKLNQDDFFEAVNWMYYRWRQIFMRTDELSISKKEDIVFDKNCPTQERLKLRDKINDFSLDMPSFKPLTVEESFARKYPQQIKTEVKTLSPEDIEIKNALEALDKLYKKRFDSQSKKEANDV